MTSSAAVEMPHADISARTACETLTCVGVPTVAASLAQALPGPPQALAATPPRPASADARTPAPVGGQVGLGVVGAWFRLGGWLLASVGRVRLARFLTNRGGAWQLAVLSVGGLAVERAAGGRARGRGRGCAQCDSRFGREDVHAGGPLHVDGGRAIGLIHDEICQQDGADRGGGADVDRSTTFCSSAGLQKDRGRVRLDMGYGSPGEGHGCKLSAATPHARSRSLVASAVGGLTGDATSGGRSLSGVSTFWLGGGTFPAELV